jgi:glyoxylase-like metal-dependent hydrolase (beta-lactamase superfamily II)
MLAMALLAASLRAQDGKIVAPAPLGPQAAPGPETPIDGNAVWSTEFGLDVLRLSPRVAVVYGDPWDNAIVAVATRKGIVVVDAPFTKTIAGAFREGIQAEFKRSDFGFLINTHEHECHIGGNEAYADIPIVGHASVRRLMLADSGRVKKLREVGEREVAKVREVLLKRDPKQLEGPGFVAYEKGWRTIQEDLRGNPVPVPPTITFDREMTLHLGDVEMRLVYYGHAHGIADTVVSIPGENLILTGGVFYPTHVPSLDAQTEPATPAGIDNWFVVMRGFLNEANGETKFLASHGRAVMKKAQYGEFVSYLEGVWNGVRRAKTGGRTLDQAKADIPLKGFPAIAKLPNEQLRGTEWENLDIHGHNIERMWQALEPTRR